MTRRTPRPPKEPPRKVTLAFAGPGESTFENTKALLDDFLGVTEEFPDEEDLDLSLIVPVTKEHLSKGIASVLSWTDEWELAYHAYTAGPSTKRLDKILDVAEDITECESVPEVDNELITSLKSDDGENYLILLWGEEDGDEHAEWLLDQATVLGIKVLDLTAGLDEIAFEPEPTEADPQPAPEPEPEPVPEPERPRRRRKAATPADQVEEKAPASSRTRTEEDTPPATPDPPQQITIKSVAALLDTAAHGLEQVLAAQPDTDTLELQQARARLRETRFWTSEWIGQQEIAEPPEATVAVPAQRRTKTAPKAQPQPPEPATEDISDQVEIVEPEPPKRGRGRPRKDGTPAKPRTPAQRAKTEYYDVVTKEWVPVGRGRIPKDVKTRKVDPKTGEIIETSDDDD